MPNKNKNYMNKPFMLNLDDPEELELYEFLKGLPGRKFKRDTKEYWLKVMNEVKEQKKVDDLYNYEEE